MLKIAIDIDTLRDHYSKFNEIYNKFFIEKKVDEVDETIFSKPQEEIEKYFEEREKNSEIEDLDQTRLNESTLEQIYNISSKQLEDILYNVHSLDIFGFSDKWSKNCTNNINDLIYDIIDEEVEAEVTLVSKEFNNSIGATYFFLAKNNIKTSNVKFYSNKKNYYKDFDIIVTADKMFNDIDKPEGKTLVKIDKPYNKCWDKNFDYSFESIEEFYASEYITELIK